VTARSPWTPDELEYLSETYGRQDKAVIARHLGRSENALKIVAYRKLNGLNQRSNIYTARAVADALGVACSKTIVRWMERGFIKGKRAPFSYGGIRCWRFEYEDIIACLRERPWLVNLKRMERSYFRTVVREEYDKDPWYSTREAAAVLGLADINPVHRYIYRGWLPALRRPLVSRNGHGSWGWIIRKSHIDAMLANDPRPARRRLILIKTKRANRLRQGLPVAVVKEWLLICPQCQHKVRIITDPNLRVPQLMKLFIDRYCQEKCTHGRKVVLERR
jgi:hypothetical protein